MAATCHLLKAIEKIRHRLWRSARWDPLANHLYCSHNMDEEQAMKWAPLVDDASLGDDDNEY
jgi:hypothetical protein